MEHAEQASSSGVFEGGGATGLLNKGGGSNRLPVEFLQLQTSNYYCCYTDDNRDGIISREDLRKMLDKITDKEMPKHQKDIIISSVRMYCRSIMLLNFCG